jgi:hypothetical protein
MTSKEFAVSVSEMMQAQKKWEDGLSDFDLTLKEMERLTRIKKKKEGIVIEEIYKILYTLKTE